MIAASGNHLWQSTLFAAVAALLAFLLRKNQARLRHWIWLAASVKFLVPFSLLVSMGAQFWMAHCLASSNAAGDRGVQPALYPSGGSDRLDGAGGCARRADGTHCHMDVRLRRCDSVLVGTLAAGYATLSVPMN